MDKLMIYKKEPQNFEEIRPLNELLMYINGKGIVFNESGDLFFFPCEEEVIERGCCVEESLLHPLSELPKDEKIEITKIIIERSLTNDSF